MASTLERITPAELRVAVLCARGDSNSDIAEALYLSTNTVKTHLHRLFTRLGVHSRAALTSVLMADARFRSLVADGHEPFDLVDGRVQDLPPASNGNGHAPRASNGHAPRPVAAEVGRAAVAAGRSSPR